jgi:BirA family biotin operon repressor/biotin-[acetyl-CoA-carboxylase] ligase
MNENALFENLPVRLIRLDSTTSTSAIVRAKAIAGEPEGLLVVAASQTAGRGQRGRSFYSPPNCGVYFSLLLRPEFAPEQAKYITTAAAVAVCRAIEKVTGVPAAIKWVNDIICNHKKVAGILTESSVGADGKIDYINLGVGINITEPPGGFPLDIANIAGAILPSGDAVSLRMPIVAECVRFLCENLGNYGYLDEYRTRSVLTGKQIRLNGENERLDVTVIGIDDQVRLTVRNADGTESAVNSGRYRIEILE